MKKSLVKVLVNELEINWFGVKELKDKLDNNFICVKNGVSVSFQILENIKTNTPRLPFMAQDVIYIANSLSEDIVCVIIYNFHRDNESEKGSGSKILKKLIDIINSIYCITPAAIVIKAEPIYKTEKEYEVACENKSHYKGIEKLEELYSNIGFKSINDYIGYESSEAMLYDNKNSGVISKIFKKIDELANHNYREEIS